MGSVPMHKALSKEVDKRPLRRMQRYMGSVSVQKAFLKEAKKRHFEECNEHGFSTCEESIVQGTLSKEVDKRSLRRMQRTWVQYLCIKHYPRKWIKDHYEECNEHGFSTCEESII
ncbi:hypothetical protein T4D_2231 [Trichinella pseudospiralis]|uniref:Uncharacterized protein n=1 Tax=Trichinella pseudospiralis TaxID=6337 RepID=A0A0V1F7A8_TRIPS|nr:hypothetical protein T4D_2231 [Trichinella pseudospiralis]